MQEYQKLIDKLNEATEAYDAGKPYMSDHEWDQLYWQLVQMEKELGIVRSDSPTQQIHYKTVNELTKVTHNHPMLSLDKTKSLEEFNKFCNNQTAFLSLKLDGLTCSLYYANGRLQRAETRGNGLVGEDVTHNAMVIPSIPKRINYYDELVVDGEIICLDYDFAPFANEYANSRNFAAGSIRLLDSKECAKRNLTFAAWEMVKGYDHVNSAIDKLQGLRKLDFHVVPFEIIYHETITETLVESLKTVAKMNGYPIDGLVLKYDDIAFGRSLGATAHHRRDGLAYKFFDESIKTTLRDVEWSMGRTGKLTPVAIFDTIELEGTQVNRANLHNLSIMWETLQCERNGVTLTPITPQSVYVYKANQIIPQIEHSEPSELGMYNFIKLPIHCPCCGETTIALVENSISNLWCKNPLCSGKLVNKLDHFCGKKGLDIKGLSIATLEKLIEWGWVNEFYDIFLLSAYYNEWIEKPGFGEKSVSRILDAIEETLTTSTLESFISAIGIPLVGKTMVRELIQNGISSYEDFRNKVDAGFDFSQFSGFGYEKSESILKFDYSEADKVYKVLSLVNPISQEEEKEKKLTGMTFVITGTLTQCKNRTELANIIVNNGGKVVGSVSKNTTYLINNDINSASSKNQAAKQLGIPIISEAKFFEII